MTDPKRLSEIGQDARAWPFEEARRVVKRIEGRSGDEGRPVLFETGYGPSGLPHIGTFGEVMRTTMVRHAFEVLTENQVPTRMLCFSDDMDGLRKVPGNVPNAGMLAEHVEVQDDATGAILRNPSPLTSVPDPFDGGHASFAAHNNARLRAFLDQFGFDYEFASSTEYYRSGRFDETLVRMLERHDKIRNIVLPLLGPERQGTYCVFLPVVEEWKGERRRQVLHYARIAEAHPDRGTAVFEELNPRTGAPTGETFEHPVTGGHCKLQWRPDWAMRWAALGVDYEMSGKDLIDSVKYGSRICSAIGGTPPEGFNYELFLDEKGQKISKSKGNGLTIEDWLRYASPESLSLFMYQSPRKAKRLYFDVIPKNVDEYLTHLNRYPADDPAKALESPVWHIHGGEPENYDMPVGFAMLLNLVGAANTDDRDVLWGFIQRYAPGTMPSTHEKLDELVGYAINYYEDFVRPTKVFHEPDDVEREALRLLDARLGALSPGSDAETIQSAVLDVGRGIDRFQDTRKTGPDGGPGVSVEWFAALYRILLGQQRGPRFGSFVALYGIAETRALIAAALAGRLANPSIADAPADGAR